jgi:hypothetical protein
MPLVGGVVDQDVQTTELGYRVLYGLLAELEVTDITHERQGSALLGLDHRARLLGIFLLARKARECDIRAFPREQRRNGSADPGIAARNQRDPPVELRSASIQWRLESG